MNLGDKGATGYVVELANDRYIRRVANELYDAVHTMIEEKMNTNETKTIQIISTKDPIGKEYVIVYIGVTKDVIKECSSESLVNYINNHVICNEERRTHCYVNRTDIYHPPDVDVFYIDSGTPGWDTIPVDIRDQCVTVVGWVQY
jgi:hypothetical protein